MAGFFPDLQEHDAGGTRLPLPAGIVSEARYSGLGNCYRLWLQRIWRMPVNGQPRLLLWIMLNPSVATEYVDDRTLAKCRALSDRWGFDGMVICNVFAYRCTDSKLLGSVTAPLMTQENLRAINTMLHAPYVAEPVMVGWGAPSDRKVRELMRSAVPWVAKLLRKRGRALAFTMDGHPKHPLYCKSIERFEDVPRWPKE